MNPPAFPPIDPDVDYPRLEREILAFWEKEGILPQYLARNRGKERWSFYDGPITANNPMGVHHAWGRTLKDVFQRHRAMKGFDQRFQNGFDCQGLWVEVEVEKDLGLNGKPQIVTYGLDRFMKACRERVEKYSAIQTKQSIRLGQFMDWPNSYYTMSDTNIEYIWHFLKVCHRKGWLVKGWRSMPWCARCGTALSQHELIDSYEEMTHRSVTVRVPLADAKDEAILVWTTTPWTLVANTALAVHPDLTYVKWKDAKGEFYVSKGAAVQPDPGAVVLGEVKGAALVGRPYHGPFEDLPVHKKLARKVVAWKDVGEGEGTGVVHIAPGCGAEDYELSKTEKLPVLVPIDESGIYVEGYGPFSGKPALAAADEVFQALERKGMRYRVADYVHRYPRCWRCNTELVFRLIDEWFIRAEEIRPLMIAEARKVRWMPDYAGKRMEDWLNNMGDWCISRRRFWGLPLPFYPCACGELIVVGSRKELGGYAGELHRPWIDAAKAACPKCGKAVSRVESVGDCWLDAGIIPFSTLGYLEDRAAWERWFPADFICEMREQIRLWFYATLFMGVTLEGRAPYRAVLTYEKVHDEKGEPMHKSKGNALWFDDAAEKMGADVMRWLYAAHPVTTNLHFGYGPAAEATRKLLRLWNVAAFFATYAGLDRPEIQAVSGDLEGRGPLDRWLAARTERFLREADAAYGAYDTAAVIQGLERFLDELSNWYVRASRRRFWKAEDAADKARAYQSLWESLATTVRVIAPVLPFTAEALYQRLVRPVDPAAPPSVHLCDFPEPSDLRLDAELIEDTALVQRLVELGRSARSAAKLRVRQPLATLQVRLSEPSWRRAVQRFEREILDELNVKALAILPADASLVGLRLKPNLKTLGPRLGARLKEVQAALAAPSADLVEAARKEAPLALGALGLTLAREDYLIEKVQPQGWAVQEGAGILVALDTRLDDALLLEGQARDLVRALQELRKASGLQVQDRIRLTFQQGPPLLEALLGRWRETIAEETLCTRLETAVSLPAQARSLDVGGVALLVHLEKA